MSSSDYLILFGDLIGSTEVASEASPAVYSKLYVGSFHLAVKCAAGFLRLSPPPFPEVQFSKVIDEGHLGGDEILSFTRVPSANLDELVDAVGSAVAFALVLKMCWLAAPYNLKRLRERKFPRDIAVGIHIGPAEPVDDEHDSDIAGLHINVSKRLETAARSGGESRIFASDDVARYFRAWSRKHEHKELLKKPPLLFTELIRRELPLDLKGIPVRVKPHELILKREHIQNFWKLVEQIHSSPEDVNVHSEKAAKDLSGLFIDNLFGSSESQVSHWDVTDPKSYIESWFNAVRPVSLIFFNDLWTVLTAFFLSCGFRRHPSCDESKFRTYRELTHDLRERLEEIAQNETDLGNQSL